MPIEVIKLDLDVLRFIFTTDWHQTDTPPGRRTKGYREEVMSKVEFIRDFSVKHSAIGLFGGDMFHRKEARSAGNTFSLLNRLIETLFGFYQGKVFGTHGNHDLYMDRIDSIPHQPIGSVISSGALKDLSTGSVIFENRDGSSRVQVDAYPYTSDDMLALQRVLDAPPREPGVTHRIVLMHQYGDPGEAPTMFGKPTIGFNRMAESDYDFALWGHDHSRTETVTIGNCTHVRLGSLARAALAEDEVDRPIAAAVLSFKGKGVSFKEVPVPHKPLEIAFVAASRQVEKVQESAQVVEFFRKMDLEVADIETTDARAVLRQLVPESELRIFDMACEICQL